MPSWILLLVVAFILCCSGLQNVNASAPVIVTYNVTSHNVTCIVLTAGIRLHIPYAADSENLTAPIALSNNVTVGGTCSNNNATNTLTIHFLTSNVLTVVFRTKSDMSYHWDSVRLEYDLDNTHFPHAVIPVSQPIIQTTHLANTTNEVTSQSTSYKCQGQHELQLKDGVVMTIYDLQYLAFGNDTNTGFSTSNVQQCPVTEESVPDTDVATAVTVGIALGAFMALVVVIYLVSSRLCGYKDKENYALTVIKVDGDGE